MAYLDPIRGLQELKKDMNQIRLQLEVSMERNPPDTGFFNAFKGFYDESSPLLVEAEEKANYAKSHYITVSVEMIQSMIINFRLQNFWEKMMNL